MQYELYIDVFFLINAIMDWMLLKITGKILSCKVGKMRILWGAFLGAFLACIVWSIPGIPGILKLLFFYTFVNVVMIQAGLGIRRSRELVRAFIVLGISAVLMAGILSLFRQYIRYGSLFFGCVIAGDYLAGGILWMLQQLFRKKFGTCRIRLEHAGQNYDGKALIDTGNRLRDPVSGEPVNILDPEIAECLLKEEIPQMREIAYHSIGKENGVMKAFRIERMIFPEKENMVIKNGLVAVSEEKILCEDCRMILNPDIF